LPSYDETEDDNLQNYLINNSGKRPYFQVIANKGTNKQLYRLTDFYIPPTLRVEKIYHETFASALGLKTRKQRSLGRLKRKKNQEMIK